MLRLVDNDVIQPEEVTDVKVREESRAVACASCVCAYFWKPAQSVAAVGQMIPSFRISHRLCVSTSLPLANPQRVFLLTQEFVDDYLERNQEDPDDFVEVDELYESLGIDLIKAGEDLGYVLERGPCCYHQATPM